MTAEDQLKRVDIRAPQDGMVFQSSVHTVGGVITAGDAIMLIVPDADNLTVEAKVNPQDIDQVQLGQTRCCVSRPSTSARRRRSYGNVTRISADATTDQRTGQSYYTIRIAMPPDEVARLGEVKTGARHAGRSVRADRRADDDFLSGQAAARSAHADVPGEVKAVDAPIGTRWLGFDMKWLSRLARRFGLARAVCVVLLFALMFLRVADPRAAPGTAAARLRSVPGAAARAWPTQRPVVIVDIDEEKPQSARPVAVAAHARRRPGHAPDQARRASSSASTWCSPSRTACRRHVAADAFRDLDEETRKQARALPSNDQVMADAMQAIAGSCLARPACRCVVPQAERTAAAIGVADAGRRSEAVPVSISRVCCATFRCSKRPPPGAGCSASAPNATASCAACQW